MSEKIEVKTESKVADVKKKLDFVDGVVIREQVFDNGGSILSLEINTSRFVKSLKKMVEKSPSKKKLFLKIGKNKSEKSFGSHYMAYDEYWGS